MFLFSYLPFYFSVVDCMELTACQTYEERNLFPLFEMWWVTSETVDSFASCAGLSCNYYCATEWQFATIVLWKKGVLREWIEGSKSQWGSCYNVLDKSEYLIGYLGITGVIK